MFEEVLERVDEHDGDGAFRWGQGLQVLAQEPPQPGRDFAQGCRFGAPGLDRRDGSREVVPCVVTGGCGLGYELQQPVFQSDIGVRAGDPARKQGG